MQKDNQKCLSFLVKATGLRKQTLNFAIRKLEKGKYWLHKR